MMLPTLGEIVQRLMIILPALTVHEFAHAYAAEKMGDPTPRMLGRLTLNPLAHIDPIGTIIAPIFLRFGWAKPVPVNPRNFRDGRRGSIIVSAAGPGSNLAQAVLVGFVLRLLIAVTPDSAMAGAAPVFAFMFWLTAVNIMLAIFNLIPLGPLDGHHIVEALLPYEQLVAYQRFNRYGFFIVIAAIWLAPGLLDALIFSPALTGARLLAGIPLN
jgi:Zn-dependent protease